MSLSFQGVALLTEQMSPFQAFSPKLKALASGTIIDTIYIYMHKHTHTHIYAHIHKYIHSYKYIYINTYNYKHTHNTHTNI
jgi:hypothetical protein